MQVRRRVLGVLVAALTTATLASGITPAGSVTSVRLERIGGDNRFETAARIARSAFSSAQTVLLARGDNFPDALAGSALAGARSAPVMLTFQDTVPATTTESLRALGAREVVLLGGPVAISENVRNALAAQGYTVSRVAGDNRFATAAEVARRVALQGIGSIAGKRTAFLATGTNFPDALGAGPLAFAGHHPVLLTAPTSLSPETGQVIRDLGIQHVVILGGTAAVADSVRTQVEGLGVTAERLAGANRADTATKLANFALTALGFEGANVGLARGDGFADALAAGPNAGSIRAPILLTTTPNTLASETSTWLSDHFGTVSLIRVYGGPAAVSDAVANEARTAAQTSNIRANRLDLSAKSAGATGMDGGPKWQYQQTTKDVAISAVITGDPASGTSVRTPIPRMDVTFTVTPSQGDTGNSTLTLRGTTNDAGMATATYTRANPGLDTITAVVAGSNLTDSPVSVVWGADAQPFKLEPDTDSSQRISTDKSYTITFAGDVPTGGTEFNITALELLDADTSNDPSVGALTFGGDAVSDTNDTDLTLAKVTIPTPSTDGVATFTMRSVAPGTITLLAFLDNVADNDIVEPRELRDKAGSVTFTAPGPALIITPQSEITIQNGIQRVYQVEARTDEGLPFTQKLDVGLIELTDDSQFTTSRVEMAWFDNDATLSTQAMTDHANPSGTTPLADNTTRFEVIPNAQGKFTFAITTDGVFTGGTTGQGAPQTQGTPVVWQDVAGRNENVRDAGEPQGVGGRTIYTPTAFLSGTLESLSCPPGTPPRGALLGGTIFQADGPRPIPAAPDVCRPLDVAAGSATPHAGTGGLFVVFPGATIPGQTIGPIVLPPVVLPPITLPNTVITGDGTSRGDVVYRYTHTNALGEPEPPVGELGEPAIAIFMIQASAALPISATISSVHASPNGYPVSVPIPIGSPLFIPVPFLPGGDLLPFTTAPDSTTGTSPYAELVVDTTGGSAGPGNTGQSITVTVDVVEVLTSGTTLITGCGPLLQPILDPLGGVLAGTPLDLRGIGLVNCEPIRDVAKWLPISTTPSFDTTSNALLGGQPNANCPPGINACYNGNVAAADKAREYYVIQTNAGYAYVVYGVGRGGQLGGVERRSNDDTYFIDGVQVGSEGAIDQERCGPNLLATVNGGPGGVGSALPVAPGCGRFEFNINVDDRIVYDIINPPVGTPANQRRQRHRLTNEPTSFPNQ